MTADETEPEAQRVTGRGAASAAKAYERRSRRENAVAAGRLTRTGSPVAAALSRVPFVATIILLLAGGIVGVLWLNTMSDATGLQATASRIRQADIETDIEALRKDVNTLQDPARLAAEATRLGLVPAGDSALLEVGADGKGTVIGTPTPVPGHAAPAAIAPVTAAPATTAPATTAPAATAPATTAPATTAPATTAATTPAKTTTAATTPAKTTPVTTTPAKTTPVTTTPAKTTPATTTAVSANAKVTAARVTPSKVTPAKVTPAKVTPATAPAQSAITTTGAGR